mgnify:CR=1 FL=1
MALARAAQFQAEVLAHYEVYEFHPVVAKLQVFCSEDLGAFYLDVLKDRLYTTAPKSLARRSAQTVLWNITHAMLRWMAPFLSFTAEEAWKIFGNSESIFFETYAEIGAPDEALLAQAEAEAAFLSQPARHPHRMVHYGHYVLRTPAPLALFDPLPDGQLGVVIAGLPGAQLVTGAPAALAQVAGLGHAADADAGRGHGLARLGRSGGQGEERGWQLSPGSGF